MHQVLDEVPNDGIEGCYYDDGGKDEVENMNGKMDGVSSGWDVVFKEDLFLLAGGRRGQIVVSSHCDVQHTCQTHHRLLLTILLI